MKKLSLLLLSLLFCSRFVLAAPKDPIKLGAILMLSGDQAVYGKALQEGIGLAVEEINKGGGIDGRKLSFIFEDSELKPKIAHTAAKKLVNVDKVTAVLNASFLETMANGQVFETAKVPVISLWDSAAEIEEIGDYAFGIGLWTPSSAKRASDFALDDLKAKTAVVISLQFEWSETVAGLFKEEFEKRGGKVLDNFSVDPKTTDFRTIILKTKSLNPDVLYSPLPDNVVPFYTQLKQAKFNKPVISSDIIADEHISIAPESFEGVYQTNAQDPSSETAEKLMAAYKAKYGKEPKLPLFVAWGYDGIQLLAKAVEAVGDDSEKIKDYLYTVKDFPGASSQITINTRGSSPVMESMFQINQGKFENLDLS